MEWIDLSHPVRELPSCSFDPGDKVPRLSFLQGSGNGGSSVTARLDNLVLDAYTHATFPGSDPLAAGGGGKTVGEYPVEQFVGRAAVIDVSPRTAVLTGFFDSSGAYAPDPRDGEAFLAYLEALAGLAIAPGDLATALRGLGASLVELKGLLVYTGLSRFFRYEQRPAWEYLYFSHPYLSLDAARELAASELCFVGTDALELEHPALRFGGQELPFALHPSCRRYLRRLAASGALASRSETLLGRGVVLYGNLRLPAIARDRVVQFWGVPWNLQLPGATTHSPVRPLAALV